MNIKDYQCKCGQKQFFFADKGNQIGIYCSHCGKWFKWADKDEQNLRIKQEPKRGIVSKIIMDIIQMREDLDYESGDYDTDMMNAAKRDALNDVLSVIDKRVTESEVLK